MKLNDSSFLQLSIEKLNEINIIEWTQSIKLVINEKVNELPHKRNYEARIYQYQCSPTLEF